MAMQSKFAGQKGAALIRFASVDEAYAVIAELNKRVPAGLAEPVKIRFANQKGGAQQQTTPVQPEQQQQPPPPWSKSQQAIVSYSSGIAPTTVQPTRFSSSRWDERASGANAGLGHSQYGQESDAAQDELSVDNVYISGLPEDVTEDLLHEVFGGYGSVVSCKAMQSKKAGQKGAALVRFASPEEAAYVVSMLHNSVPAGLAEPIKARFANQKGGGGAQAQVPAPAAPVQHHPSHGYGHDVAANGYGKEALITPWRAPRSTLARSAPYETPGISAGASYSDAGKGGGRGKGPTVSQSDIAQVIQELIKSRSLPSGPQPAGQCLYVTGLPTNTTDFDLYRLFAPFGPIGVGGVHARPDGEGRCTGVRFVDYLDPHSAAEAMNAYHGMVSLRPVAGAPSSTNPQVMPDGV